MAAASNTASGLPYTVRPGRVDGAVRPPGSKSASHRALMLALLARHPRGDGLDVAADTGRSIEVVGLLTAEDTQHALAVLVALGWQTEQRNEGGSVGLCPPPASAASAARTGPVLELWCGAAGTLYRFLTAVLTTLPGRFRVDGVARLRERPITPLVTTLRDLGAGVEVVGPSGGAPLVITGESLAGGVARLDAGESSQYLSALLLAGQRCRGPLTIEVAALTSAPYVELTARAIARVGGDVERVGTTWRTRPSRLAVERLAVEGDWSAAGYPAAAAALTGGEVELFGLDPESAQGDRGLLDLLVAMGGVSVEWSRAGHPEPCCRVRGSGRLVGCDVDLGAMPDQVPTVAALAPFAVGVTRIRGVAHLRLKESDRLAAMARELTRLGVSIVERADGLEIPGVWAGVEPPVTPVVCAVDDDHRIAMSLALVGLRRPGVSIADPGVVAKSYPGFWRDLERLQMGARG